MKGESNKSSDVICRSPLNNSTSKACFSFGRAPRSPKQSKTKQKWVNKSDVIYQLPSMTSNRATHIGFGKKSEIAPKNSSPSPDRYDKPSQFDKSPKKGLSFGISRQNFKAVSMFFQGNSPGPGFYENPKKQGSRSFAMRGRDGFPEIFHPSISPGPGKYDIKQETDKQFFANSKRRAPAIFTFARNKQNNQKEKGNPNLGPASYQTGFASMGRQILANNKTQKSFVFSKQVRQTMHLPNSKIGPGSYQHFSQFGK